MQQSPRPAQCIIHLTPYEVDLRLSQLDVPREVLTRAVLQGELQRRFATPDDFHATAGYTAWARTYRELVSGMRSQRGWHKGQFLSIPVVYTFDETYAIAVSPGDSKTADPDTKGPSTHRKGPATSEAVARSRDGQLEFEDSPVELWYLVYDVRTDGSLHAELSRPLSLEEARITAWSERVILGRIDPEPQPRVASGPESPEIDVSVRRKTA